MRLDNEQESSNIENRRGRGGFGFPGGGNRAGGFGGRGGGLLSAFLPLIFSRFGIVGVVIAIGALFLFNSFGGGGGVPIPVGQPAAPSAPAGREIQTDMDSFVARVLATTEESWGKYFAANGERYPEPTLVLYAGSVQSACGSATSAAGPFYCPGDQKIYLDTSFFDQLAQQFGAPGDFAAAYVIAHEVGHHIQTVTGISEQVRKFQSRSRSRVEGNQAQVRMELQADCFAGVWASQHRDLLDEGDFEEGVAAAQAIGDDRLQRQAQGTVVPDSFTHGTSAQRVRWLTTGFRAGDPDACDTFGVPYNSL